MDLHLKFLAEGFLRTKVWKFVWKLDFMIFTNHLISADIIDDVPANIFKNQAHDAKSACFAGWLITTRNLQAESCWGIMLEI